MHRRLAAPPPTLVCATPAISVCLCSPCPYRLMRRACATDTNLFRSCCCPQSLSGGNKRKLSVAIAMIGKPPIVFMDGAFSRLDRVLVARPCRACSPGVLRLMCCACLEWPGGHHVSMLTEPSTGMDPVNKRFMWEVRCRALSTAEWSGLPPLLRRPLARTPGPNGGHLLSCVGWLWWPMGVVGDCKDLHRTA